MGQEKTTGVILTSLLIFLNPSPATRRKLWAKLGPNRSNLVQPVQIGSKSAPKMTDFEPKNTPKQMPLFRVIGTPPPRRNDAGYRVTRLASEDVNNHAMVWLIA